MDIDAVAWCPLSVSQGETSECLQHRRGSSSVALSALLLRLGLTTLRDLDVICLPLLLWRGPAWLRAVLFCCRRRSAMKDPRETEVRDVVGKDGRDGGWQLQVLLTAKSRYTLPPPPPPPPTPPVACSLPYRICCLADWLVVCACACVCVCLWQGGGGGYGGGGGWTL